MFNPSGRKRRFDDDLKGGGGGGGGGAGDGDDSSDEDYVPSSASKSRSPSPGQAFRNAQRQQQQQRKQPDAADGRGRQTKRQRASEEDEKGAAAAAAAAKEAKAEARAAEAAQRRAEKEAAAAEARARREAEAAERRAEREEAAEKRAEAAEESRRIREEFNERKLEMMREKLRLSAGQVFAEDLPVTDTHAYQAWLWDPKADHAAFAAKTQHSAPTKVENLGLKLTIPIDSYCEAWLQRQEQIDRSSFEGLQSNGKYCWACEHRNTPEFADRPSKYLLKIEEIIRQGRRFDTHYTAQLVQGCYIRYVARTSKKVWELEMIITHITEHMGDEVYQIKDLYNAQRREVKKLARRGAVRDPAGAKVWEKMVNLELKLLTAKIRIERDIAHR
jgi:hypothetical protein